METGPSNIAWKYGDRFYLQDDNGRFVETVSIVDCEVFTICSTEEEANYPFDYEHKYEHAYGQFQATKATHYYREITRSLRLIPSRADIISTLRKSHGEVLDKFLKCQHWQAVMDQTPRSMAKSFVNGSYAESWPEFLIKLINRANRTEDAYSYWLILRWLKCKIAHYENSTVVATQAGSKEGKVRKPVTQASLALFYYYCQEKGYLPPFPAGQMEQAYKDATAPHNLAWKPFQQHYNRIRNTNERLAESNHKALLAAKEMLEGYPAALRLIKDELNIAETRKGHT